MQMCAPARILKALRPLFNNVDLVVIRENTEDLYAGIERKVDDDTAEGIKLITRKASTRIVKYAFEYAEKWAEKLFGL